MPEELAAAAAGLGYEAIALTDHDGIWGSMEFAQACRGFDLRPITGAELTVAAPGSPLPSEPYRGNCPPGCFHLTLLVEDAIGYRNLCRLLTIAHAGTRRWSGREDAPASRRHELIHPALPFAELEPHSEGLVCLSGCARDGALGGRLHRNERGAAERLGRLLAGIYGRDRFRVELQRPLWRGDRTRNRRLAELAGVLGVATVATGNVHYHDRRRAPLQDALVAARLLGTLESTEPERRGNGAAFLTSAGRMAQRFGDHPEAVAETAQLAERLRFDLTRDLGYRYPGSEDPDAPSKLAELCATRFGERYDGTPERPEAERRLAEELRVIAKLDLSGFFLLHRDLLELAREVAVEVRGPSAARALLPPGRGRGSSVSSVVCYLTGLSHVDPVKAGLFLGRFLNDEITEAPDIDLDFPRDVREVLIPRIHERYGAERSALVAAFPTYRSRGSVRDLGAALGLPQGEIERVARSVDVYGSGDLEGEIGEAIGEARARSERWRALVGLAAESKRLPRHASQHPGGMVLSTRPLIDLCPVVPAAMEGRRIAQWDKDSCADAGFLKIDLLGLGMLSAVERTVDEIARSRDEQSTSRGSRSTTSGSTTRSRGPTRPGSSRSRAGRRCRCCPARVPESIEDLTVQVALVRPGPIQGGAVHPYLERKKRLREDPGFEVPYEHPSLEPILSDTLGAIVFQDQVIQVAMALAGFSAGEAEGLRRAMSRKRSEEALNAYREQVRRRGDRQAGRAGGREPRLRPDQGLLRLRLPEVPRRRLRPAGLPVDLAAGPLRTRVPLRSAQRAADGLLPARRPRPRGSAPRDPGARPRREPQRSALPDGGGGPRLRRRRSGAGGPGRARIRDRIGPRRCGGRRPRPRGGRSLRRPGRSRHPIGGKPGRARDDSPGRMPARRWRGELPAAPAPAAEGTSGRWGSARGARRSAPASSSPCPCPLPDAPPLQEQSPWERVTADYAATGISLAHAPGRADPPGARPGDGEQRRSRSDPRRSPRS